jgi:hypothetical protein
MAQEAHATSATNHAEESDVDGAAGTKLSRSESGRQTRQRDNRNRLPGCPVIGLDFLVSRDAQCDRANQTVQESAALPC